jgi:hypothetical protein
MRASINGDGPAVMASGQFSPDHIAVDATSVYWVAGGSLWRVPIGGGMGEKIPNPSNVVGVLAVPPNVLVAFGDSSVAMMPSGGGNLSPVVPSGSSVPYGSGNLAADSTVVCGHDYQTIVKSPLAGGPTVTLVSYQNGIGDMAVDAANVYWTVTNDGSVLKTPLDGNSPPYALASLQSYPTSIAVDASNVYWTNHDGASSCAGGAVMKVAIAGGPPVTLASNQPAADGIAIDATNVYWTTGGSRDSAVANGAVMKLPLR